ncbi:hypothetical protein LTR66_007741 [Elasticomyces elasticus]|nr:hypothetical protein LTR66_007741 [Elasticomyces elasticus]
MGPIHTLLSLGLLLGASSAAPHSAGSRPFDAALQERQASPDRVTVDLGYEVYRGVSNASTGLTTWKGIRFAAAPVGDLRWQAPQPPSSNRTGTIQANAFGPTCPQSSFASPVLPNENGNEDCLFLNVYAPSNASNLPVFVYIHGGGYGLGSGRQDMTSLINTNNNDFIAVVIQYRLGAFGFLSSDEVFRNGVVNAGILDQHFALQWVQSYISMFGGNASQVTIGGESAGAGSVMLQDLAYGGTQGTSLFRNTFSASPYLPMQYGYKDFVPSQSYYAFATAAGCPPTYAYGNSSQSIFRCLVAASSQKLQNASFVVSASGVFGTWGFLPVTDGVFIQQLPSQQLLQKQLNGQHLLVGNDANEGPLFTPQNITTEADLLAWLRLTFPLFTNDDIAKVLLYYPSTNASVDPMALDFATNGVSGPTALNESQVGSGQQQRADNIYAETSFVCPSYWMAEAYSDRGRASYRYQYSVPLATHGTDLTAYFGPVLPNQPADFERAFMQILGNFVVRDNPSISADVANGARASNPSAPNPATNWPPYSNFAPYQINLNTTGGTPYQAQPLGAPFNVTQYANATNDITLVNAYTWEGGRGYRCDFWRSVAAIVPE